MLKRESRYHKTAALLDGAGAYLGLIVVRQYTDDETLFCPTRPDLFVEGQVQKGFTLVYDPTPEELEGWGVGIHKVDTPDPDAAQLAIAELSVMVAQLVAGLEGGKT